MSKIGNFFSKIRQKFARGQKPVGRGNAAELGKIIDNIPMALYWKDVNSVYRGGNAHFEEMTGLEKESLPGKTDFDLHTPENAALFRQEDADFASGKRKEMYFVDKFVPLKNSQPMWGRTYKIPVFSEDKKLEYIIGLIQDVTKIKQAEIALAESESRLRTILDATVDHVVFVDPTGKILTANSSFMRDFGLSPHPEIDVQLQSLVTGPLYEMFMEGVRKAGETNEIVHFDLLPHETPMHRFLEIYFYPVVSNGVIAGTAIFAKDISERKHTEEILVKRGEELQKATEAAESANKSKSDFLSRMSHEIRTPLSAIIGMTKIAGGTDDPVRIKDCLKKIDSSSKHLLGLINDILDMSKIEADKFALSEAPFKLADMLFEIAAVIGVKADEKNLNFKISVDPAMPKFFIGDELRLRQIITNLLSNATKFTPEGGNVGLYLKLLSLSDKAEIEITVSDTGIGLSEQQLQRLFQPFEQADGGIARKYGGTGLGLAICKKIVEMMGGKIRVESAPNAGSSFILNIKLIVPGETVQNDNIESRRLIGKETVLNLQGVNLLIVEDIDINREIAGAILEQTHAGIDFAENGKKAVEMFNKNKQKYDLILMDLHMPEMDGYEATKLIRRNGDEISTQIPIIAMTADAFKEDIDKCKAAGMNDHIAKPIDEGELFNKIDAYRKKSGRGLK